MNVVNPLTTPRRFCAGFCLLVIGAWGLLAGCAPRSADSAAAGLPTLHLTTARIGGFDPAHSMDQATVIATGRIYEGLFQYAYWDRPYRLEPLLAETMPSISDDGLVWRFTIRRGIHFSDDPCFVDSNGKGRELVAQDIVYSILRIADMKVGSSGYWIFRDRIAGLDAFREASKSAEPTDYSAPVEGLRAPGSHELEIRLTAPYPQLSWVLAMPYAFAVPREAVEFYGDRFVNHPVGTGPYVLASMRQNYRYEYRANPKWTETGRVETLPAEAPSPDAGQRLPLIPRIVDVVVGDPSTAWLMFLSGELDRVDISREQWESIMTPEKTLRPELADAGLVLHKRPDLAISYTAFNMDDPVVGANRLLRQALSCAFDAPQWVEFQHGRVMIPTGPVPPGVAGHSAEPPPYSFNIARAKQLLADAGYPGGQDPATGRRLTLTLELGSADNPETRQAADLLAHFMSRIGVVLQPSYNNWPAFLQKLSRRQAQLFSVTWLGDYPDAQNFLQLFSSDNTSPGPNRANYVNAGFDRLYRELTTLPPGSPAREALCQQAAAIVLEDCPWILTGYPMTFTLCQPRLGNFLPHDYPWGLEKYWSLR